jgi:outer membrane protein assembly factor BamB
VPVWKIPAGSGHASPVVADKRVYTFGREGEDEVVACNNFETGRPQWRDRYFVAYTMNHAAVTHGKGPKSTPVISDGRLYTLGITGILSCYEAKEGALRWRKDFAKQFKTTSPYYGTAMSPVLHKGAVIVHVGGHDSGSMMAIDGLSGETRWSWSGDGPGYASPIIVTVDGVEQVVTQSQKLIVGLSFATGDLLWSIPFETEFVQNIVTPVVYKDLLIFSGINKGTFAVRPLRREGKWNIDQVWKNPDVSMYMSSPVVSGDYIYGLSHLRKGQYFCLDAQTGKTQWTSTGREGDNASIAVAGGLLFMLSDTAELTVARTDPAKFDLVKKYTVAPSPTWAHPAIIGNRLLIKDASSLILLGLD